MATKDVVKMIEASGIHKASADNLKRQLEDLVPPPLPEKGDALLQSLAPKPPPAQHRDSRSSSDGSPEDEYEVIHDIPNESAQQYYPRPQLPTPPSIRGHRNEYVHSSQLPSRPPPPRPLAAMPPSPPTTELPTISTHTPQPVYQPKPGEYMHLQKPSLPTDSEGYSTVTANMIAGRKAYQTPQSWAPLPPPSHEQERKTSDLASLAGPSAAMLKPDAYPTTGRNSFSYDTMSLSSSSQYSDPTDENIEYLKSLSCLHVIRLLESMRLECYQEAFQHEQIDGEVLSSLDDEMLVELGVKSSLHRLRLKKVIKGVLSAKDHLDSNTLSV